MAYLHFEDVQKLEMKDAFLFFDPITLYDAHGLTAWGFCQ